jgi:hypothetical protein
MAFYWPNCEYNIYLNTEKKKYWFSRGNINVKSVNYDSTDSSWTTRLKYVLNEIDSDYVILLLEDFFLQDFVKQAEIDKCLTWMNKDANIGCFYFKKISGFDEESSDYPGYIRMEENLKYKYNCQAGLWRKSCLVDSLIEGQSPWEFETVSHTVNLNLNNLFFCVGWNSVLKVHENDIFTYLVERETGFGVWSSIWLWNNKILFKKHGIIFKSKLKTMSYFDYKFLKWKQNSTIMLPFLRSLGLQRVYNIIKSNS